MRLTTVTLCLGLLLTQLDLPSAAAQAPLPAPLQLPARWSYAAKFVCGLSSPVTLSPPKEPIVKRGNYATVVNIHNLSVADSQFWCKHPSEIELP